MNNKVKEDANSIEGPMIYKMPKGRFVFFPTRRNTAFERLAAAYAISDRLMGPYVREGDVLKTGTAKGLIAPGAMGVSWNGVRDTFHAIPKLPYEKVRAMHAGILDVNDKTNKVTVVSV